MIKNQITDNIKRVQEQIARACARAGRNESSVTLVAVTKTHPIDVVLSAYAAGLRHFGENRIEEAVEKVTHVNPSVDAPPTWHFIGHIQSRKASDVVPHFDVVHSVDRIKIARKLSEKAQSLDKVLPVMMEINVSGEASKYGFDASNWRRSVEEHERLLQAAHEIMAMPNLRLTGLMTMAPFYDEMEATRPTFAELAALRDTIQSELDTSLPQLSMGMTNDYPVAIEEGATIVRIGRAIFGARN